MKLQELSLSDLYGLRESLQKRSLYKAEDIIKLKRNCLQEQARVLELANDKLLNSIGVVDGVIKELEDDIVVQIQKEITND
jgi:hypothetical protein